MSCNVVSFYILALGQIVISCAVIFIVKTISVRGRTDTEAGQRFFDNWHKTIERAMFTKRNNSLRFKLAVINLWNRTKHPKIFNSGSSISLKWRNQIFELYYLIPEPSADETYDRLTGGKFKYDSWRDIDRYLLTCSFGNLEPDRCAVWQELRKLIAVGGVDLASVMTDGNVARVESDPEYGEVGLAYVRNGNGSIGPIATEPCAYRRNPFAELSDLCATCQVKKACSKRQERPDDACKAVKMGGRICHA